MSKDRQQLRRRRAQQQQQAALPPTVLPAAPVAVLQRQLGNRTLARLLSSDSTIGSQGGIATPDLTAAIAQRRGRGNALPGAVRDQMEERFSTSFADVTVHHDPAAHLLARQVSAEAFTTGNDIFLSQQAAASDQSLMAHELTHVVQQRSMQSSGPLRVTAAADSTEKEAEKNARTS